MNVQGQVFRLGRRRIGVAIATVFGAGYSPVAPGTVGTLAAVPLAYLLGRMGTAVFIVGTAVVIAVAIWAATQAELAFGEHDSSKIVVDEVAGYMVAMLAAPESASHLVPAFVLFRAFDILKPPPIGAIDRRVGGGLGVVLDDLLAGVYAAVLLWLLDRVA